MFSKEDILEMVLRAFSREGSAVPNRAVIEETVDQFLKPFAELSGARNWIISEALRILVTSIGEAQELVDPNDYQEWLDAHDRSTWRLWPWLNLYLRERLRRPAAVMDELNRSSDRVLELIGAPYRSGLWDRRGMVVGHVQSGKTQHYTAVAAKAIDAGYKLVIILSGIHENLRQQTQERIEECITGKNSREQFAPFGVRAFASAFKGSNKPEQLPQDISSLTSVAGDFGAVVNRSIDVALGEAPVVLVIKKNVSILRNLLKKLRGATTPFKPLDCPTLVIDDEADHSSVNTAKIDEETDPTRINELIRKILWACNKVAFLGYTATPYANIFMEDNWVEKSANRNLDQPGSDLFPRAFILGLEAPSNYIGPDVVFGHDGDESMGIPYRAPLPMHELVNDADIWLPPKHKSSQIVTGNLPNSLVEALNAFILSISARSAIGQDNSHCSMLIHVTRFNAVQEQVMQQVKAYLESLATELECGERRQEKWNAIRNLWERLFVEKFPDFEGHSSQHIDPPLLPEWVEVEQRIIPSLGRLKYAIVNSLTKENLDFAGNKKNGLIVVAVGGDRLSRGLTLEGLTVSYFLRGARAYDTLMQMGRWFGYRPGYAHFCRIYAPLDIMKNFRTITLATEELRREFSRMCFLRKTPKEYGLRVREPRADLLVTALNKMRRGESVRIHFAESLISSLDIPENQLADNFTAFKQLIESLENSKGFANGPDKEGNHLWADVDWDLLAPFFSLYNANSHVCLANDGNGSLLNTYIQSVRNHGELKTWTVVVIGSQTGVPAIDGKPYRTVRRKRLASPENEKIPLNPGRIAFQGVAMGRDERRDLSEEELARADSLKQHYRSSAAAYRAVRPASRGLLLLYPIIPTLSGTEWTKEPVVGVAVSLPGSEHDSGCEYVCNRQKLREIFGTLEDDLERDADEDNETC